jgi:hypothetical protein
MASAKISLRKSGWMLLQATSGLAIGWCCDRLQAKIGLKVPEDLQTEILASWAIICVSLVHGATNYIKHALKDRIAVKPTDTTPPIKSV